MRLEYIFRTLLAMSVYHICALTIANNALNAMDVPSNFSHIEDFLKNQKNNSSSTSTPILSLHSSDNKSTLAQFGLNDEKSISDSVVTLEESHNTSSTSTPIFSLHSSDNESTPAPLGLDDEKSTSDSGVTPEESHNTSITIEKSDYTGKKPVANVSIFSIINTRDEITNKKLNKSKSEPDLFKYNVLPQKKLVIPISNTPPISNQTSFRKPSYSVDYNKTPKISSVITTSDTISEKETPTPTNEALRKDSATSMSEEAISLIEKKKKEIEEKKKEIDLLKNLIDNSSPICCKEITDTELLDHKDTRLVVLMRHGETPSNSEKKTAGKKENIKLEPNLKKAVLLNRTQCFNTNNIITSEATRTKATGCLIVAENVLLKSTSDLNELDFIKPNKDKDSVITTFLQQLNSAYYLDNVREKGDKVKRAILQSVKSTEKSEDIVFCISHNSAIFSFFLQSWLDIRGNDRQLMENIREFTTLDNGKNLELLHMGNLDSLIIAINCESKEYKILNTKPISAEELALKLPKLKQALQNPEI